MQSHEATQTKQPEQNNLKSFFSLPDTGILSHYFEPPVVTPPTPLPPPPPPPAQPPPTPIKTIENKSSQTIQKSDIGSQAVRIMHLLL